MAFRARPTPHHRAAPRRVRGEAKSEPARRVVRSLDFKWGRTVAYLLFALGCCAVAFEQFEVYVRPSALYCTSPVLLKPFPCDAGAAWAAALFVLFALGALAMAVSEGVKSARKPGGRHAGGDWG